MPKDGVQRKHEATMENLKADKKVLMVPSKDLKEDILVGNALDAMMVTAGWKMFEKWIFESYKFDNIMHFYDADKGKAETLMRERMAFEKMFTWLKARKEKAEYARQVLAEMDKANE